MTERAPAGVLQVGPLMADLAAVLSSKYQAVRLPSVADRAGFLSAHGSQFAIAVTSGTTGVSKQLMDCLPNLRAVIHFGVGYDKTDVVEASRRKIAVSNTPDVLNDCVADLAVGLLIDAMRGISAADRYVRSGAWSAKGPFPLQRKVSGSKVGIVGLGRIGMAVARRLEAFGIDVHYYSRRRRQDVVYRYSDSVISLATTCDAIIVTASGGSETGGLISAEVLQMLGSDGYIVNVARGSIVDENALVDALERGVIAGAALDVYAHEPMVPAPLRTLENVVLLPHIGSGTGETRLAMSELVLRNLEQFIKDGTLITPVDLR